MEFVNPVIVITFLSYLQIFYLNDLFQGQLCDYELPMQPITMMRNALGVEEGGSGIPLDRQKYRESVAFWVENVAIK